MSVVSPTGACVLAARCGGGHTLDDRQVEFHQHCELEPECHWTSLFVWAKTALQRKTGLQCGLDLFDGGTKQHKIIAKTVM